VCPVSGLGVNPTTNTIYVALFGLPGSPSDVQVINGVTNVTTAAVVVGENASNVAVNAKTNTIYVTNDTSLGSVSVINGAMNTVAATIGVGTNLSGVGVTPTNVIYLANPLSNTVSIINGVTNKLAGTLQVGQFPGAVGVNTATNVAY